jgi:NitT/TauT family transport system substrate-binding protein
MAGKTLRQRQNRGGGALCFSAAFSILAATTALLGLPGCDRAPKEVPTIRLGYASHDHHSPFYIAALNPDYFRDKGGIYLEEVVPRKEYRLVRDGAVVARVTADSSTGGKQLVRKLAEGQFDMAFGGVPAFIGSIDSKPLLRIVAPVMTEGAGLVVGKEMPVSNWEEFTAYVRNAPAPVRIGYKTAASVQNLIFEHALRETGISYSSNLDDSSVNIAVLDMKGPKNLIPALEGGLLDGFVVNQPFPALAEYRGAGKLIASLSDLPPEGKWKKNPCCALAAGNRYLEEHPDVVSDFVTLMLRANLYIQENPEAAATQISEWLGTPAEVEKSSIPTIFFTTELDESWERGVNFWIESMLGAGKLQGTIKTAYENGTISRQIYSLEVFNRARERM